MANGSGHGAHVQTSAGAGTPTGAGRSGADACEPSAQASTPDPGTRPPRGGTAAATPLEPLTPNYVESQHGTYLRRLEEAVKDPSNVNIALTGRYGAGKSSVLDQFQANHRRTTQRLAISTLAPGEEGETTTNRIQKEIVKQLLYGASQKVGKNSRFSKIAVLTKPRAFVQSAVTVGCVAALLYLLGWLPTIKWTGADEAVAVRVAAWTGAAVLATLVVSAVRMATYGRFLSDVSAGGAALTLAEKPESFFDLYLDEIVHYFSRESKDIVIFEDLDRFEDPGIFEALRELNILLNETPERRAKRSGNRFGRAVRWLLALLPGDVPAQLAGRLPSSGATRLLGLSVPLRFVYAVKDSVFEKLDSATAATVAARNASERAVRGSAGTVVGHRVDAAAAETLRANRTKFFDIVIPLVPFISHRNARDLLLGLLEQRGITGVERRLVNAVAQHCTDMRLLRNMCNEYLVFAERLLERDETAPGMDRSHLFALIAYKNFHPEDFENITRRDSALDRLYELHLRLVRENIAGREERKRALLAAPARARTRAALVERLDARLTRYATAELRATTNAYGWTHLQYKVGSKVYLAGDLTGYPFWSAVAQNRSLTILAASHPAGGQTRALTTVDSEALAFLLPECLDAPRWAEYDENAAQTELADLERDIEQLRRADFSDLVTMPQCTLPPRVTSPGVPTEDGARTFAELLTATLRSQLGRELVRRGYIDRNFSLYAAQFYGHFTGTDVATYMVQHVQTNTMAVDYDLSRAGAVANLLAEADEAGEELAATVAAYNIDIVNHLLTTQDPRAGIVVDHLIGGGLDQDGRTFLAAYFTSESAERRALAEHLARHRWPEVFAYLVGDEGVPGTVRPALVSAAMSGFDPRGTYDLGADVRDFITTHYSSMPAMTEPYPQDDPEAVGEGMPDRVATLLDGAGVVIPELEVLEDRLRDLVVKGHRYELTADNLRVALGSSGDVSLDRVRGDETVYAYCVDQLRTYLAAIGEDPATRHALSTPETLLTVLRDVAEGGDEDGDDGQQVDPVTGVLADLLAAASPDARLTSLRAAPRSTWSALAAADLFRASLVNVEDYRTEVGSIDADLSSLLDRAGTIHVRQADDTTDREGVEYDRQRAAVAILNASEHLAPARRVALAASLKAPTPLPVVGIAPEPSALFAHLLEGNLVADDETTFAHFQAAGWDAIGPAIAVSHHIDAFLKPDLVEGMVADVLADPATAAKVGRQVLDNAAEYVPDDDWPALKAIAGYADTHRVPLTPDMVVRIAREGHPLGEVNQPVLLRLLCATEPAATADHIVDVFTRLGHPYADIARPGARFKVPYDGSHDELLRVLKGAGRISRHTPRGKRAYGVTVL